MTTRRWMIAVAIAAIASLGAHLWLRRREYQQTAAALAAQEALTRARMEWASKMFTKGYIPPHEEVAQRAELSRIMARKQTYLRAAARPWLPVPRDPSESK